MIDHFDANVTIDILIVDINNKIVVSDSWNERISKNFYEETKNFEDVKVDYDFVLEHGEYNLNIIINDFENHINWIKNSDLIIQEKKGLSSLKALYKFENKFKEINHSNLNLVDTMWINYMVNNSELSDLSLNIEYLNVEFLNDFVFSSIDKSKLDFNIIRDKNKYEDNILSEQLVDKDQIILTQYEINTNQYIPVLLLL